MIRPPPSSPLFPYTTLFRSRPRLRVERLDAAAVRFDQSPDDGQPQPAPARRGRDRKSTRLNSSHPSISYAVFCLKKKNDEIELHIGWQPTTLLSIRIVAIEC